MTLPDIQSKIRNARDLDFGTIFNQSIELFKKVWLQGLLMLIISCALMVPLYLLMYVPLIAMGVLDPQSFEPGSEPSFMVLLPMFLTMIVFTFFAMIVSFSMQAAFFRICRNKDLNIVTSDDYFFFMKKQHAGTIVKLALSSLGITVLAMLLCGLPLLYAMVPVSFFSIVFAFNHELSASEIIKASFDLGNKKWLLTFGLMFISSMLAQIVGLIMCFVGIFVTACFVYLPIYFVYKETVGFQENAELEQIGKDHNDINF